MSFEVIVNRAILPPRRDRNGASARTSHEAFAARSTHEFPGREFSHGEEVRRRQATGPVSLAERNAMHQHAPPPFKLRLVT